MLSQRDRARAAVARIPKLDFAAVGALRGVLAESKYGAKPDGSIDLELWDDLTAIANGLDAAVRALERIKLRARPHG